jgi:FtsZ-binding cell division protein ZapB
VSKELAKTQTKVVESLETIETLRREVDEFKKSAPKELAEHQAKAEERLKSLQENNDAVELKIKKWRAAHQAVLEEEVLAQKDFEEAMRSKTCKALHILRR